MSQPPAPSSSFEWSPGLIIGIAGAAAALFCIPIAIYLVLRWRHLERRRAESSEAGVRRGRTSKDRAAVPQRRPVVGVAEGRVDLAIWSPISARRDGFVVLPELAYRPDEKVRTSVINLPGTYKHPNDATRHSRGPSHSRTHAKTPSVTSLSRILRQGRRPIEPDSRGSSTVTYVQPSDLLFGKDSTSEGSRKTPLTLKSADPAGRSRRNVPPPLTLSRPNVFAQTVAPAAPSSTIIAYSLDTARTSATVTATWSGKADPASASGEACTEERPAETAGDDKSTRTSRSSSLSTALSTATSLTHSNSVSRRRHAEDMEEVHVVSAYSARKSIAVFSSLPGVPDASFAMPPPRG